MKLSNLLWRLEYSLWLRLYEYQNNFRKISRSVRIIGNRLKMAFLRLMLTKQRDGAGKSSKSRMRHESTKCSDGLHKKPIASEMD